MGFYGQSIFELQNYFAQLKVGDTVASNVGPYATIVFAGDDWITPSLTITNNTIKFSHAQLKYPTGNDNGDQLSCAISANNSKWEALSGQPIPLNFGDKLTFELHKMDAAGHLYVETDTKQNSNKYAHLQYKTYQLPKLTWEIWE